MRIIILFVACGLAFGQLDTNTLTITASRNVNTVPDQVVFSVSLSTDVAAPLDDVVTQLASTGITAANLSFVSDTAGPGVNWYFELVTPFAKMKDTVGGLSRLKEKLGSRNGLAALTFSAVTQRTSQDAHSQACPLTALVSDARRQAEGVASAAGVRLGAIVGLWDRAGSEVPTAVLRTGDFIAINDPIGGFAFFFPPVAGPAPLVPCSMVVQFRLLP